MTQLIKKFWTSSFFLVCLCVFKCKNSTLLKSLISFVEIVVLIVLVVLISPNDRRVSRRFTQWRLSLPRPRLPPTLIKFRDLNEAVRPELCTMSYCIYYPSLCFQEIRVKLSVETLLNLALVPPKFGRDPTILKIRNFGFLHPATARCSLMKLYLLPCASF